jgi:hypothetical protein
MQLPSLLFNQSQCSQFFIQLILPDTVSQKNRIIWSLSVQKYGQFLPLVEDPAALAAGAGGDESFYMDTRLPLSGETQAVRIFFQNEGDMRTFPGSVGSAGQVSGTVPSL